MNLNDKIDTIEPEAAKQALDAFLKNFCSPAFGALSKREIELAVFELLQKVGVFDDSASLYELMTCLRVTRSKAKQLIFDVQVRQRADDEAGLEEAVREAITRTKFAKDGSYFVLEIENPLVQAYLKNRIKKLGYVSDSSFNTEIVRLPLEAVAQLMLDLIEPENHAAIKASLEDAGAPAKATVKSVIKGALGTLGSKVVGAVAKDIAEDFVDGAPELIRSILEASNEQIGKLWSSVFGNEEALDEGQIEV